MFYVIKESFNLTNKYIVLATPLILFSLFSSLYLLFSSSGNLLSTIFAIILFFLMLSAFLSGWLLMIKKTVASYQEDANALLKEFPAGVGEYFLPISGMIIFTLIIFSTITIVGVLLGMKFIGNAGITPAEFSNALSSNEAIKNFVSTLSTEQLIKISQWNLLLFGTMLISYFLVLFYPPALMFKNKNPFFAFFVSIKDIFSRKFFQNIVLFIIIFAAYFVISIFTTVAKANLFAHFVLTLVNFYYIVFAAVYVFNYYYRNYIKIGSNIDTTIE